MRIHEVLTEALSPIVYHYTSIHNGIKIIESGQFELSSSYGSVEQQYAPKGYPYFMSTTRTRLGGYHQSASYSGGVLFTLDGNWYNSRYPSKSIDYWENRNPDKSFGREHEAEDRLFSKEPSVPIGGVLEIHVLAKHVDEPENAARARKLLITAKSRGIKTYLYTDTNAWRLQDKRKLADVSILSKGIDNNKGYVNRHRGYLMPWMELIFGKDPDKLSKKANDAKYTLLYYLDGFYGKDAIQGLENDFANARRPNSGPDRNHIIKIINFMQKNNLHNVKELLYFLKNKWSTKSKD
jgi:hypothetical protein